MTTLCKRCLHTLPEDLFQTFAKKGRQYRRGTFTPCIREMERARYSSSAAHRLTRNAAWYAANKDTRRLSKREWQVKNPHKATASVGRRRALKLNATPRWADEFLIEEAYALAALRTKMTGVEWHVDHLVPLQSPKVCGLHVHNNLCITLKEENQLKGNRYWPGMTPDIDLSEGEVPMT